MLLASSIFWGIVSLVLALVIAAIAVSGKFSMRGADVLLTIAWIIATIGIFLGKPVADCAVVPRILTTMLCISLLGFAFYGLSLWLHSNSVNGKPATAEEIAVEVAKKLPSNKLDTGNLKQRANDLADEMLIDLSIHGWPCIPIDPKNQWRLKYPQQLPSNSNGVRKWGEARSDHFKFTFYDDVLALRNEFAQLYIMNKSLEDFIKQYNQKESYVGAQQIGDIAEQLKTMAAQIK